MMQLAKLLLVSSVLALTGCQGFKKAVGLCTCNDTPEMVEEKAPAEPAAAAVETPKARVSSVVPLIFFLTLVGGTGYLAYKSYKLKKAK